MSWESFGVVGFDLGPLLQDQTRIAKFKVLITCLLLILEVYSAYNSLIIGPRGLGW